MLAEVLTRYGVRRVAFAGFSDGASYALTLALANGDLVEHVIAFSPGGYRRLPTVGSPRVWVSHGAHDQVLPVELCGRKVTAELREQGYEVRYVEFNGGHVVIPTWSSRLVRSWRNSD